MIPACIIISHFKRICLLAALTACCLSEPGPVVAECQGNCKDFDPMGYPTHVKDQDGDGYTIEQGDCDDLDPLEYPGQHWYKDMDNDGFSDGTLLITCLRPPSYKAAAELSRITGDINDQIPDPELASFPVISSIEPPMLIANKTVTIRGNSFGDFQGSAYVHFHQDVKAVNIISWRNDTITCEVHPSVQNGCVEIMTVMGKSNCVNYTIARPMPWLFLLRSNPVI